MSLRDRRAAGPVAAFLIALALAGEAQGGGARAFSGQAIRGVTLAPIEESRLGPVGYGSDRSAAALAEIAALGAEWVSLTPFGRMDDLDSTDIAHDFEIPVAENEALLRKTIAQARALGLKVALIPHIYVMSGEWRGRIDPGSEERVEAWFSAYEQFVLRFAALAESEGAELFSVGVEFGGTTASCEDRWRRLIALVRSVYSGPLTYSANWDEAEYVPFWDALDLIGINAFWPLAARPEDGFFAMRDRARAIARQLEGLALYFDRPILFTEFGVKSARGSALAPWEWPEHLSALAYDEGYQAEAYEAVFEAIGGEPWWKGLFIWKYFADPNDETQEDRAGFSPRGKLAEALISDWFRRPLGGE